MEKYILKFNDAEIAIKYDLKRENLIIGGFSKHRVIIEFIITDYFSKKLKKIIWTQKNKMRYKIKMNRVDFDDGIILLNENEYELKSVKNLKLIMR